MNLLPFETININSPFTRKEIADTLKNSIVLNTNLGLTFSKNSFKDYEGVVEYRTFKIRRILKSGINSFIPIVSGVVSEKANGSQIQLKLRLHKVVMVFSVVFTVFAGSLFVAPLFSKPIHNVQLEEVLNDELLTQLLEQEQIEALRNTTRPPKMDWNGLLLFLAPYLLCTVFYNYEAKIVKDKLTLLLKTGNNNS